MKKIRIFNWILIIISGVYALVTVPNFLQIGRIDQALMRLAIIPIMMLPYIFQKIAKIKINELISTMYIVYLFCAYFMGSVIGLYHTVTGYDKLMHLVSGVLTSFLGLVVLLSFQNYKNNNKKNIWYNIIVIVSITLAIACFWEFFEFTSDKIFKGNVQHVLDTGVDDTMIDMLMAFIGSIAFCILYAIEEGKRKKGITTGFIELIKGGN